MPNYLSYYSRLCETRKLLDRSKGGACYYEEHHILPRSLGGNDSKDNLVLLTPREHPHCNKVGQTNAMKRWHFDKCKEVNHA